MSCLSSWSGLNVPPSRSRRQSRVLASSERAYSASTSVSECWSTKSYEYILTEKKSDEKVALLTLNRPKALNALCDGLISDIIDACAKIDDDDSIGCIVLTGSEKAFAAGADIKEMANKSFVEAYGKNMFSNWGDINKVAKPIVGAVNGFALGGGCELMMMCDILIAGENAKFGQPEIKLGVIPGCGGTQRLVKAIGKSRAMEIILTGDMLSVDEAVQLGLVSRKVPVDQTLPEALKVASTIAQYSLPVIRACKETVNANYEMTLEEGLRFERRTFHSLFALNDQKEGMAAFIEKRKPNFTNT